MGSAKSVEVAVKALLIVLLCVMIAAFAYVIAIDGVVSCFDIGVRWGIALLVDFFIYVVIFGAWFFYKESSYIKTIVFVVLMFTLGSVATIGYILFQFFKLSAQESSTNPLYFVLTRHHKREHTRGTSVVTPRVIFSVLGSLMMGALIYTVIIDIYAAHVEAFSPVATCVYIVRQLRYLSSDQPISLIIFNSTDRDLHPSDPLLVSHAEVHV